jgi:hypothetical protein
MYEDRPYLTERPDALRRLWETCARSDSSRASPPGWQLDRWKAVRDLIVAWYADDRPDAEAVPDLVTRLVGWMDDVQRSIVERQFAGWRAMYPKDPDVSVDLEPPAVSVVDHDARVELRVSPTFRIVYPDGSGEQVRVRTGRFGTGPDDAAVFERGREHPDALIDAMVSHGVAEEVELPPDSQARIVELIELAGRDRRVPLRPGIHCFGCASAARCGQYPVLGEGRVYLSTRSIVVSKSQLAWLGTCERRVAWDRVFGVPPDRDDDVELGRGLSAGVRFHEVAAAAILADDPVPIVAEACRTIEPAESAELQRLWDNHRAVWDEEGHPEARTTEFPAGFTLTVPGVHVDSRGRESTQPVAVTFIGVLDVTGRESDGTPMVVEHRTGQSGDHSDLEPELYAVSAAEAIRRQTGMWPERVAVHLHHLRPDPPVCVRSVFTPDDLARAVALLTDAAIAVAGWHPLDTRSARFTTGPWCDGCRHRATCENFRS